jgi:hypothetical protein
LQPWLVALVVLFLVAYVLLQLLEAAGVLVRP